MTEFSSQLAISQGHDGKNHNINDCPSKNLEMKPEKEPHRGKGMSSLLAGKGIMASVEQIGKGPGAPVIAGHSGAPLAGKDIMASVGHITRYSGG